MNQFNLFLGFHIQLLSLCCLIKYSFSRASLHFIFLAIVIWTSQLEFLKEKALGIDCLALVRQYSPCFQGQGPSLLGCFTPATAVVVSFFVRGRRRGLATVTHSLLQRQDYRAALVPHGGSWALLSPVVSICQKS